MKYSISAIVFAALAIVGCTPDAMPRPAVGESSAALTADQCNFFDVNGKVQICHHTSSVAHPFSIIRVSAQACVQAHSGHSGDYVTSTDPHSSLYDPTCQGMGCLSEGAPCDATVPCCDGLTCSNGTCMACTLTDLELLDLPNGWKSSGDCGEYKLFVYDQSSNLLNPGIGTGMNVPLMPGTYTYTLRGDGFDLNGGSGPTPTLSLFSSCGNATEMVEGSSVTLGGSTVTVTSFSAGRDDALDSLSPCDESPDGEADIAGSVTLQVTAP